jgi:hypothetical protein
LSDSVLVNLIIPTGYDVNLLETINLIDSITYNKQEKIRYERMKMMNYGKYRNSKMGRAFSTSQKLIKII